MAALVAALWAYDGWNDLNMVSGEIRNPERNIPLALIFGVALVGVLYMLVNAAVQYVLPATGIAISPRAGVRCHGGRVGKSGCGHRVGGNGAVDARGHEWHRHERRTCTVSQWRATDTFSPRSRRFIPAFIRRRLRLWCKPFWRSSCCLLGGSFRQFFSLAIFAEWLFYMIASSTVFVFRKRDPEAVRPYRVWGYPVVPALFVLASTVLLYYTFTGNLRISALGCLAILAGIPVFYAFARRRARMPEGSRWERLVFQVVPFWHYPGY